jgi:N-acetyl-anhydromuramyl-L-alanine amidase AmpD
MNVVVLSRWLAHRARRLPAGVKEPDLIVMHSTAGGTALSSIAYLRKIGYSYHYVIDRDGTVYKCVPASQCAFHAGVSKSVHGENVNEYSVGVCFANRNDGKEPITQAQEKAARELALALKEQFKTLRLVTRHLDCCIPKGRKSDPRLFDMDDFARDTGLKRVGRVAY